MIGIFYCRPISLLLQNGLFEYCIVLPILSLFFWNNGYYSWASTAGGREAVAAWIFIHGTNIVERGYKVLFFGVFYYFSVFFFRWLPLEIYLPTPWYYLVLCHWWDANCYSWESSRRNCIQ